jgi:hypothetical protein
VEAGRKAGEAARDARRQGSEKLLGEAVLFPETDEIAYLISQAVMVMFKRRLVDRVLRLWTELARGERFPRRDQIEPSMLGEDWANCLVIAVQSPVQLSHFVALGNNLSVAHCPNDTLAGVLLLGGKWGQVWANRQRTRTPGPGWTRNASGPDQSKASTAGYPRGRLGRLLPTRASAAAHWDWEHNRKHGG